MHRSGVFHPERSRKCSFASLRPDRRLLIDAPLPLVVSVDCGRLYPYPSECVVIGSFSWGKLFQRLKCATFWRYVGTKLSGKASSRDGKK